MQEQKILTPRIVHWRGHNCLVPPNGNLICRLVPIANHIDQQSEALQSPPKHSGRKKKHAKHKSLNFAEHIVLHTTSLVVIDYDTSQWHIVQLRPNFAKRCWGMQAYTWGFCSAKDVFTNTHQTRHACSRMQRGKEGVLLHQQCVIWVMVMPW